MQPYIYRDWMIDRSVQNILAIKLTLYRLKGKLADQKLLYYGIWYKLMWIKVKKNIPNQKLSFWAIISQ